MVLSEYVFCSKSSVVFSPVRLGLMPTVKINGENIMNTYMYLSDKSVLESMKEYAVAHYDNAKIITEKLPLLGHWRERKVSRIFVGNFALPWAKKRQKKATRYFSRGRPVSVSV